jgi:hypothetical protein
LWCWLPHLDPSSTSLFEVLFPFCWCLPYNRGCPPCLLPATLKCIPQLRLDGIPSYVGVLCLYDRLSHSCLWIFLVLLIGCTPMLPCDITYFLFCYLLGK